LDYETHWLRLNNLILVYKKLVVETATLRKIMELLGFALQVFTVYGVLIEFNKALR
jgi:hypothetical protein